MNSFEYLSVSDLAKKLNFHRVQIYRLLKAGKLPEPIRIGSRLRWRSDVVERWLDDGKAAL
ncbi:MAG: helix-turn-helix transcriptional regulator [Thiolinea sp.]